MCTVGDIADQFRGLVISPPALTVKYPSGKGASSFAASASKPCEAYGYACASASGVAVSMQPSVLLKYGNIVVPDELQLCATQSVSSSFCFNFGIYTISETSTKRNVKSVQSKFESAIGAFFGKCFVNGDRTMGQLAPKIKAFASDLSRPDGAVCVTVNKVSLAFALMELKGTSYSPDEQLGQVFVEAARCVLAQLHRGIPWDQCLVIMICSNGKLWQFAAVTLLEYSVPQLNMISPVLDAASPDDLRSIATHLARLRVWVDSRERDLAHVEISTPAGVFDKTTLSARYILKQDFPQLFPTRLEFYAMQNRIAERLHEVSSAVLHVGALICEETEAADTNTERHLTDPLIYHRLDDKFLMGVPASDDTFEKYLVAVIAAVKGHLRRGVVHMDLYASNIMWRELDGGEIEVKIVDWDAASFLGEPLRSEVIDVLGDADSAIYYQPEGVQEVALPEHDAWFVYMLHKLSQKQRKSLHDLAQKAAFSVAQSNATYLHDLKTKIGPNFGIAFREMYGQISNAERASGCMEFKAWFTEKFEVRAVTEPHRYREYLQ